MNSLEKQLDYPLGDALPEEGTTLDVAPGVKWIRMVLPFALNHINLWLIRDEMEDPLHPGTQLQGWTVVDCCISRPESKAQWETIFATQLEGLPILRVIVTHMHPDHIGLAHWLCERWTTTTPAASHVCRLWASATDFHSAKIASQSTTGFGGERAALFFQSHGLTDPDSIEKIKARTGISTNVSVYDTEPEADALALFLESIDKFLPLPIDTLTLPSHGKPFRGLHTRIQQLHDHHRDRLAEVMQACALRPHSAADILPIMFKRELDLHQTTFAIGEALAHLHLLWLEGKLQRQLEPNGVYRFSLPAR